MVLCCIGDPDSAYVVVDEVLRRAAPSVTTATMAATALRRELFRITRDVLPERPREQWSARRAADPAVANTGVTVV